MEKKHNLATISEILDVVNEENLAYFLKDFEAFLFTNIQIIKFAKSHCPELDNKPNSEIGNSQMIWIDNKKRNATIILKPKKE